MRTLSLRTVLSVSILTSAIWQCHDHDARRESTDDVPVVGSGDLAFPTPDVDFDSGHVEDPVPDGPEADTPVSEDAPTTDLPAPDMLPPRDLTDTGEEELCVMQWEECLVPLPGCWMSECPELTECTIAGCDPEAPGIYHLIQGGDYCGNGWVVLGDATGRIEARDIVRHSPYGELSFTTYLDEDPQTTCNVVGLPTGAIRYQMTCNDLDGEAVYAAVLETGPCPDCRDVAGCYAVEADPIICGFMPCPDRVEKVQILSSGGDGCRVSMRFDTASMTLIYGWVSYDGVLTLEYNRYGEDSFACTFENTGDSFGPAICRSGHGEGATTMELDISLTRTDEDLCELPECVLDESCQMSNLGETCVDGHCQ